MLKSLWTGAVVNKQMYPLRAATASMKTQQYLLKFGIYAVLHFWHSPSSDKAPQIFFFFSPPSFFCPLLKSSQLSGAKGRWSFSSPTLLSFYSGWHLPKVDQPVSLGKKYWTEFIIVCSTNEEAVDELLKQGEKTAKTEGLSKSQGRISS